MRSLFLIATLANGALAQAAAGAWAQCGGQGWTGSTTCVAGYTCNSYNVYYSQCIPGGAASSFATTLSTTTTRAITTQSTTTTEGAQCTPGTASSQTTLSTTTTGATTTAPTTSNTSSTAPATSSTSSPGTIGKFKWLGVDESVAEFGSAYPGTWGKDFYFPDTSTIQTLIDEGYNIFRVPFMMERMVPDSLTGAFGADYLKNYTAVINYITTAGAYAVLDPHNYGRYKGNIINDTSAFQTFWFNFAGQYQSNGKVIFDTNNEYNTMDQTLVLNLNQAAIDGIRAAGATSQYIFAEGNQWTGAWTWTSVNTNMVNLTDPENKLVYEMHQYFNADGSSSDTCVNATIGSERLASATAWLRQNGKVAFLGEFSGYPNSVCLAAVTDMLNYMQANSDVWLGGAWWAAGPWWGTSEYSFEPPSGVAYQYYDATLRNYLP